MKCNIYLYIFPTIGAGRGSRVTKPFPLVKAALMKNMKTLQKEYGING